MRTNLVTKKPKLTEGDKVQKMKILLLVGVGRGVLPICSLDVQVNCVRINADLYGISINNSWNWDRLFGK